MITHWWRVQRSENFPENTRGQYARSRGISSSLAGKFFEWASWQNLIIMYPQWINDKPVSSLDLHPRIQSALSKGYYCQLSRALHVGFPFVPSILVSWKLDDDWCICILLFFLAGLHRLNSVLILSAGDLSRRTGLSRRDTWNLVDASSKAVLSNQSHTTALKIYRDRVQETNSGWIQKYTDLACIYVYLCIVLILALKDRTTLVSTKLHRIPTMYRV